MARLPKCYGCVKYIFAKGICKKYEKEIPKDILLEKKECEEYVLKKNNNTLDDLPLAKGR